MRILPKTPAQQVRRLTTLVRAWAVDPGGIGLTPARVAEIETLLAQAQDAQRAAYIARDAARSATLAFENATAQLKRGAAAAIGTIKAAARNSGQPVAVLALAQLPVPAAPSPIGPPGTPTGFSVDLLQNGSIVLSWTGDNPSGSAGTMYEVRRRIGSGGTPRTFEFLGVHGTKSFTDDTIPVGSAGVVYKITPIRSTRRGQPALFNVNFGAAGGAMVTSAELKTAA